MDTKDKRYYRAVVHGVFAIHIFLERRARFREPQFLVCDDVGIQAAFPFLIPFESSSNKSAP